MRRPLRILALAVVAGLPLLLVAAADLALVPAAEKRLEQRARAATDSASVRAEIGEFPVVGRALALGELTSIDLTWRAAKVGSLEATSLDLELDGVGLDRGKLLEGEARITGVESGEVRMSIDAAQFGRFIEQDVFVDAGRVRARLSGGTVVDLAVSATNRALVLAPAGVPPVTVDFGGEDLPCAPTVRVQAPGVVLECSFRGLPPVLRGQLASI